MVVKYFDVAVQAIFKNWTALQLLVNNVRPTLYMCGKNLYKGEEGGGDGGGEGGSKVELTKFLLCSGGWRDRVKS